MIRRQALYPGVRVSAITSYFQKLWNRLKAICLGDSDYNIVVKEIGMKLDFVWAHYEKDLDNLVVSYKKRNKYPDVVIMGSGLWHMLHVNKSHCLDDLGI